VIANVGYDNWVGLGLAVAGILYLLIVLVFPERF
jgi:F subunit of K+-transporting ATPase (Potass_KdpF)